jgi:hypothetical protein
MPEVTETFAVIVLPATSVLPPVSDPAASVAPANAVCAMPRHSSAAAGSTAERNRRDSRLDGIGFVIGISSFDV